MYSLRLDVKKNEDVDADLFEILEELAEKQDKHTK